MTVALIIIATKVNNSMAKTVLISTFASQVRIYFSNSDTH